MKKIYKVLLILTVIPLFMNCSEAEEFMFEEMDAIYFRLPDPNAFTDESISIVGDTIFFTFAYFDDDKVKSHDVFVPLEVVGFAADRERKFHIEVKSKPNTVAGVDYVAPDQAQPLHADKMYDSLRVTFNRTKSMQSEHKELEINIIDGGDFIKGVKDNLHVVIKVSDMLEKPVWWDKWSVGFGEWHPAKLREWFKIWGTDPLSSTVSQIGWYFTSQECMAIVKLKAVFDKAEADGNPFLDEHQNILKIPANF